MSAFSSACFGVVCSWGILGGLGPFCALSDAVRMGLGMLIVRPPGWVEGSAGLTGLSSPFRPSPFWPRKILAWSFLRCVLC